MKKTLTLVIIAVVSVTIGVGISRGQQAEQKDGVKTIQLPVMTFDLATGPDRDKVTAYCGICHGVEYIPMQPKMSKTQWTGTVTKMIKVFGAPVPQEDADKIIDYLAAAYGTGK
jgi:hypothetical protein